MALQRAHDNEASAPPWGPPPRGGGRTIQLWFALVPSINNGQSVSGQSMVNQSMANQSSVQIFSGTNRWSTTPQSINQWQRCGDVGDFGGVVITSSTCASRLGNLAAVAANITFVIGSYSMEVIVATVAANIT